MMSDGVDDAFMYQSPYPLSMHICEAAYVEPTTWRRTIRGCMSTIVAREFPTVVPILGIFAELTDGRDRIGVIVRLGDSDDLRPAIIDHRVEIEFPDPLEVVALDFHFTGVVFPLPGEYRAQLFAVDEFLMERRITLVQSPGSY